MSAEFYNEPSRDLSKDEFAVESFRSALEFHQPLSEFIRKIFKRYQENEDGNVTLIQMRRVAEFITQQHSDEMTPQTTALFEGQLIASQILNYIHPDLAPVGELANTFMKRRLKQSTETAPQMWDESNFDRRLRLARLAMGMRKSLSDNRSAPLESEALEQFISSISQELYGDNTELSTNVIVGFRLIFKEYPIPFEPYFDLSMPQTSRDSYLMSNETLSKITGIENQEAPIDMLVPTENISYVQNNLMRKFSELYAHFNQMEDGGELINFAIYKLWERNLQQFNRQFELIKQNDLLLINGNFIAKGIEDDAPMLVRFENHIEIRGVFEQITIAEVPSNKEFLKYLSYEFFEDHYRSSVPSPALRIKDPVVVMYTGNSEEPRIKYGHGITLDIPLVYKNIDIQRPLPLGL